MLKALRRMSLRTRLAMLAAFAILAMVFALFVAGRLTRATETFALRQADSSVRAAARDLARELQQHPNGYQTTQDAMQKPGPGQDRPRDSDKRQRLPPHIESAFREYSDPLVRLTTITLHQFPDLEGGFYSPTDGEFFGYYSPQHSGTRAGATVSPDLIEAVKSLAGQVNATGAPATSTIQLGRDRVLLAAYPSRTDSPAIAWAMQRLSHLSGVSDWPNLIALLALAFSIMAVSGLALITVRDLRLGVSGIEAGLSGLKTDLRGQLPAPDTEELARIAAAINELAKSLSDTIERQTELERQLRKNEKLTALGRVVAGVAHEVRNPLSAIKLKVQLAGRSSYPPEKLAETFNVIQAEIDRLDLLVRRLLELGGQQTFEKQLIDLGDLLTQRVALFKDLGVRTGVQIATAEVPGHLVIEGDRDRLGQVMDNIIRNAIEAMPDGGELTISSVRSQAADGSPRVRISFDDTGPGISAPAQERIFEPFFTGRDSGTGLGLAIARSIVEEHGGSIVFANREGRGASFVIELPGVARASRP
jgi:signal transduction histidine kinase